MKRALGCALLGLALLSCRPEPAASGSVESGKPELGVLTSLPLLFGETFSLDGPKHPLTARLERDFQLRLIDGPEELAPGGLLLAVQPQALTAERLVALDKWVRNGGRLVLLADPRFTFESARSLTDKARPPFAYPDTGLLQHWGLRLEAAEEDGPAMRKVGAAEVLTSSPGSLRSETNGPCTIAPDALVARCKIGRGEAVVIADADFVQAGVQGGLDGPTDANHEALAHELIQLAH